MWNSKNTRESQKPTCFPGCISQLHNNSGTTKKKNQLCSGADCSNADIIFKCEISHVKFTCDMFSNTCAISVRVIIFNIAIFDEVAGIVLAFKDRLVIIVVIVNGTCRLHHRSCWHHITLDVVFIVVGVISISVLLLFSAIVLLTSIWTNPVCAEQG